VEQISPSFILNIVDFRDMFRHTLIIADVDSEGKLIMNREGMG